MKEEAKSALEKWKERFRKECPTQYSEALELAGKPVTIFRANETGEWVWAVAVSGSEFWMDAFDTEAEAEAFVKEVGWPIDDDFLNQQHRKTMKEEEKKQIQCPSCKSTAVGRLRIDCDWGDGGDWMRINKPDHYTAEELARFDRNERPDVECYICCRCGTCFE